MSDSSRVDGTTPNGQSFPGGQHDIKQGRSKVRVRVQEVGEGMHPSEVVVSVRTADGEQEKLIVDRRSLKDGTLYVGFPVGSEPGRYLIELPRETLGGSWRVWVNPDVLIEEAAA